MLGVNMKLNGAWRLISDISAFIGLRSSKYSTALQQAIRLFLVSQVAEAV